MQWNGKMEVGDLCGGWGNTKDRINGGESRDACKIAQRGGSYLREFAGESRRIIGGELRYFLDLYVHAV